MKPIDVLRGTPNFASLPEAALSSLDFAFSVQTYPDGHAFFRDGDHSVAVHLVLSGRVVVKHKERLREHVIRGLTAGDFFGLLGVMHHRPRSASCIADGPCEVATIPGQAAMILFHQSAPLACAFQRVLAAQLARDLRASDVRLRGLLSQMA